MMRPELDLFANVRPYVFTFPSLIHKSPLKTGIVFEGVDFCVFPVRLLTEGFYFGSLERKKCELKGT